MWIRKEKGEYIFCVVELLYGLVDIHSFEWEDDGVRLVAGIVAFSHDDDDGVEKKNWEKL